MNLTFAKQYESLLTSILSPVHPHEVNERTGVGIRFIPAGANLSVRLSAGLPLIGLRKTFPRTAAAEVEWFISGQTGLSVLHEHDVHIWDQFAVNGMVASAYGFRWRSYFGRDQLREAIATLRKDPTSRRVVVSAWDPGVDGVRSDQVATPCPVGFTLSTSRVTGPGKDYRELNSTLWIRSSDVFVGLPYDVMGHAILIGLIANELGMRPGWLSVSLAHPHLYDVHADMAHEALASRPAHPHVGIAGLSLSDVEEIPGSLVDYYGSPFITTWPSYNPKPEVVR